MEHQAARPKGRSLDDESTSQPMRPAARGQIARNPSTDQKRVRRANMRKSADWTPGHVSCRSCGYVGHPMMSGGATGPECSHCGSYEVSKTRPEVQTGGQSYPENSRYLHQGDYGRTSAKQATVLDTRAEMLNPGDQIRTPNGRTMKVTRVRPHETHAGHVYVDTDGGTALVKRTDGFQVVPKNSQQQSLPGYGTPGGNANHLPFDPQSGGSNSPGATKCPNCQASGTLARKGDHFACSRCGYQEAFGGAGGHSFSDASSVVRTFSTLDTHQSAVARRATALLNQEETQ